MKRSILMASGAVALLLLLAGAAFVGGRMLSDQNQLDEGGDGSGIIISDSKGTKSVEILPAKELPSASADVRGVFVRREDNTIIVGTGEVRVNLRDGEIHSDHDGPEVEVVVTHDTMIYRDKTQYATDEVEDGKLQQVVKPGSLEEIEKHSFISVWGQERGSRLFAGVLVYKIPLD